MLSRMLTIICPADTYSVGEYRTTTAITASASPVHNTSTHQRRRNRFRYRCNREKNRAVQADRSCDVKPFSSFMVT